MRLLAAILMIFVLAGCEAQEKAPGPLVMADEEMERWEIDLVEMRIEKNEEFQDSTRTALPLDELATFEGLNYYYPEPSLRFKVPLQKASKPDTAYLTKRKGRKIPYLRQGTVTFQAAGGAHTLAVFGPAEPEAGDYLWLPFYDATNESETYGGGRYLELEPAADGTVIVDFNFAYNPLCDYNPEKYDCTLPPEENRLEFPVRAGEKRFSLDE